MERLTIKKRFEFHKKGEEVTVIPIDLYTKIFENTTGTEGNYYLEGKAVDKLADYEDLEEKLEKVYGKCEGLLETAVNSLVKHEGAEIDTPAKARLLTDEDVDKWESYKAAEEQGLLIRLPCKVGDKIYQIEGGYIYKFDAEKIEIRKEDGEYIYCIDYMDYRKENFGKIVFLTKEEAEQALARMEENHE